MTLRAALLISLLLGTTAMAGCGKGEQDQVPAAGVIPGADKQRQAEPPRPVRYLQVGMSNVGDIAILPGEIRPRFEQRYGFRVGGKIAQRLVDVGQEVKAGQILALLDSQDVLPAINAQAAQVEVSQSDLKLQRSELRRQQELRDRGFVSGAALERQIAATESAQSRLRAAQSQLANAKNGLDFQTLRADMAGAVVAVDAEAGSVVAAGQSIVRVAQLGEKEVAVNVPERAVALMKKARGYSASLDALPARNYTAKLRELSPVADPASRTYAARLSILNADESLKLGMSATVRLDLGAGPAIVVPNSALYTRDDTIRVWLVDRTSETVKPVAVKVGESTNDGVTILSGLQPGDLVVTAGANLLLPGQKVRLPGTTATPAPTARSAGKS
ncbi:MAG: efflux RND transporter periplasmic adaptor subunit [Sterolibacterium sp.]|jgi:RND family efflux transporter MFP subunit